MLPPLQPESYLQMRQTVGEGTTPFRGIRRFRVNLRSEDKNNRFLAQIFYKEGNRNSTDDRIWLHDVSLRHNTTQGIITIGQFRPAFSRQRLTSDRELLILDRAIAVDAIMPGGGMNGSFARDKGVQWEQDVPSPTRPNIHLTLGVFQGSGTLQQAGIGKGAPLFALRAVQKKHQEERGLAITTRHSSGRDFSKTLPGAATGLKNFVGQDTRIGMEWSKVSSKYRTNAEFLTAYFRGNRERNNSASRTAQGAYIEGARRIKSGTEFVWQFQYFDPDTSVWNTADIWGYTVGINLTPTKTKNRWQLNYTVRREGRKETPNNRVQLQYQMFLTK
jgi:phosphate-selective porin